MNKLFPILSLWLMVHHLAAQPIPAVFEPAYTMWANKMDDTRAWNAVKDLKPANKEEEQWQRWFELNYTASTNQYDEVIQGVDKLLPGVVPNSLLAAELLYLRTETQMAKSAQMQDWKQWDNIIVLFAQKQQKKREAMARMWQASLLHLTDNRQQEEAKKMLNSTLEWLDENLSPKEPIYHTVLLNVAGSFWAFSDFTSIEKIGEKGLAAFQKNDLQDPEILAQYYSLLGMLYNEQGDSDKGETFLELSLKEWEKTGNPYQIANALYNTARVMFLRMMPWESIRPTMQKVVKMLEKEGWDPARQAQEGIAVHTLLSEFYINDQQLDKMTAFYDKYQNDIIKYDLDVQNVFRLRSDIHYYRGEPEPTIALLEQKLAYNKKRYGNNHTRTLEAYFEITRIEADMGLPERAIMWADEGLEIVAAMTGNSSEGTTTQTGGLFIDQLYASKAKALEKLGRSEEAIEVFKKCQAYIASLRHNFQEGKALGSNTAQQKFIASGISNSYWSLYQKNSNPYYLEQIFGNSEKTRSLSLFEYLTKYRSNDKQALGVPDSLLVQQEQMLHQINSLRDKAIQSNNDSKTQEIRKDIAQKQMELKAFNDRLQQKYPDAKLWQMEQNVEIKTVQSVLDSQTVVIFYAFVGEKLLVFYITKDSIEKRFVENTIPERYPQILQLLQLLQNPKECPSPGVYDQVAHQFYMDYVAAPIAENKKNWIIIPDGLYCKIPFEALVYAPSTDTSSYGALNYLVKKHNIRYEYSATLLVQRSPAKKAARSGIFALAAEYGKHDKTEYADLDKSLQQLRSKKEWRNQQVFAPLQGSEREVKSIQGVFGGLGNYALNADANESALKKNISQYPVIHLATHGIVDTENDMYNALALTENMDSTEDNFLYTYEIYELNLQQAQLVVLSACQTGDGIYVMGEGVRSVAQAFMYAGASSLVSTLWELNDESSAQIMEQFYRNLYAGQPKDVALRNAKLDYLGKNKSMAGHPFFWASFTFTGDAAPIQVQQSSGFPLWGWGVIGVGVAGIGAFLMRRRKEV